MSNTDRLYDSNIGDGNNKDMIKVLLVRFY
jgi:hypothetical protein